MSSSSDFNALSKNQVRKITLFDNLPGMTIALPRDISAPSWSYVNVLRGGKRLQASHGCFEQRFGKAPFSNFSYDGAADDKTGNISFVTLPRLHVSKSPRLDRRRPSLRKFESSPSLLSLSSRSPDRFLPKRPTIDSATESYRANRDPRALSIDEKLLRNKEASPDAFNPRRTVTSPIPHASRSLPRRNISVSRNGSNGTVLGSQRDSNGSSRERQISTGTVWQVGGVAPVSGVSNGRGGLLGSGTNAPLYTTSFSARPKVEEDSERHEHRLAEALGLDRTTRVLEFRDSSPQCRPGSAVFDAKTVWMGTEWVMNGGSTSNPTSKVVETRTLPTAPFKVLDAPNLRDDFYCSIIAYSNTCHTLAVGLGPLLYAWSELRGVHLLHGDQPNTHLTSLAFSSTIGEKSILAFGRSDGSLNLMSIIDVTSASELENLYPRPMSRFEVHHPLPIACLTWRPQPASRPSRNTMNSKTMNTMVKTEDLLVGDETGQVFYYTVEWPHVRDVEQSGWSGSMTLLCKIAVHTQQICGLSFSCDGFYFATGGNDNLCCLYQTRSISQRSREEPEEVIIGRIRGNRQVHTLVGRVTEIRDGAEKHRWIHGAAVKAIAFCPWRDNLVATGGGSNDKCIHFFHTSSGTCLATISVAAQVTSLIWSMTRREIAATFGYAQPEHPYRIAVFSWPGCKQVAAIPWEGEHRALYAIPYPAGPNDCHTPPKRGKRISRTAQEGCIVVASSDESVKFHEVWNSNQKATAGGEGLLGGSDILEALEGIDKEGEVIR